MDIMTLLGHTTLQMTSRYTHAMPENLRTAVDSLGQTNPGRVVRFKRKSAAGRQTHPLPRTVLTS